MTRSTNTRRRGFTLLETVIVVLVLSLTVPAAVVWVSDLADRRSDATQVVRASLLAQSVMEQVLADVSSTSPGLGPAALSDLAQYLEAPGAGLRHRIDPVSRHAADAGINFDLRISPLVNAAGVVDASAANNRYRIVTVETTFTSARGTVSRIEVLSLVPGA